MNREEVLQFKKRKYTKFGSFRGFGILFGLITLLAMVGGLVLALAFPMLKGGEESLINFIYGSVYSPLEDAVYIESLIYWSLYSLVVVGTALYLFANAIKMLSKKTKYSVNRNFGLPAFLAVLFVIFTSEQTAQIGATLTFSLFKYLFLGGLVLTYIYSVVQLIASRKLWKRNGKRLSFAYLLSFIATAGAIALCLTIASYGAVKIGFTNVYGDFWAIVNNGNLYDIISALPHIESITGGLKVFGSLITILFFVQLVSVASILLVDFIKIFLGRNYVRGSNYFRKSGVFANAFMLAIIPVALNIITMAIGLIEGVPFDFNAYFTIENIIVFGSVLLLAIIVSSIFISDKSKSRSELAELIPVKKIEKEKIEQPKVIEKPVEEEIIKVDAVEEAKPIEEVKEQPIVEEKVETPSQPEEVVEPQEVEEAIEIEEFDDFEEEVEEIEEKKVDATEQQIPPMGAGQPYVANMNIYPNAIAGSLPAMQGVPQYGIPIQMYNPMTGQVVTYYAQLMPQPMLPTGQMMPQQMMPQTFMPFVAPMPAGQNMPPVAQPVQQQTAQPVENTVKEEKEVEEKPNFFAMPKKTLEEKIAELPQNLKIYYKQMISYASSKEGVKYSKSTFADTFYYGRDSLMKMQVKQNKIVCSFSLVDVKAREMLKSDKYAKDQQTIVKIINKASLETAKDSFDMAYNLVLEAREARHQEQLRRRREARKANK